MVRSVAVSVTYLVLYMAAVCGALDISSVAVFGVWAEKENAPGEP